MMIGSRERLGVPMPIQLNHAAPAEMVATSGGGGGGSPPARAAKEERLPQWSQQETRDFIAIRGELDSDFNVSKRNKTLWEVVAVRMRERGHRRSPDQCKCKWKNLVNRYKKFNTVQPAPSLQGKETSDPDSGKQCSFFDELHAIFTERSRNMQQLLESETGAPSHSRKKLKRSSGDKSSDELPVDDDDEDDDSDDEHQLARSRKRKPDKVLHQHQRGSDKSKGANSSIRELLQDFFRQQQRNEAQWWDSAERRARERRVFEQEWWQTMEKLERKRLILEQAWQEREEQRRLREENRAVNRDALVTALLNKLIQEGL